ncbi:hypothetical protein ACFUGD_13155 [Streptomyces sp. NPDC057217]|uniref:hypothetical protein n=1 Tax=Streptomyces sp. NPDC057217 TaxID=3346054 RepID=UPI003643B9ED
MPALPVAAGGGLDGEVDALLQERAGHGPGEVEPVADGAGGGEQGVGSETEVHALSLVRAGAGRRGFH